MWCLILVVSYTCRKTELFCQLLGICIKVMSFQMSICQNVDASCLTAFKAFEIALNLNLINHKFYVCCVCMPVRRGGDAQVDWARMGKGRRVVLCVTSDLVFQISELSAHTCQPSLLQSLQQTYGWPWLFFPRGCTIFIPMQLKMKVKIAEIWVRQE